MKNSLLIILIILITYSCKENTNSINTPIGNSLNNCIDSVLNDGNTDRYCEIYYSTGELKEKYTTRGDTLIHGIYKSYYENGNLKDSCYYAGGALLGIYKSFYSNGLKKRYCDHVVIKDGDYSYRNQLAEFDSITQSIDRDKSFYYSFEFSPDKMDHDSLFVHFNFDIPKFKDTSYLELGDYDEFFRLKNKKVRIIPVKNNKAEFKISLENKNHNFMRGMIHNFDKVDTTKHRLFYFYEKYEVN